MIAPFGFDVSAFIPKVTESPSDVMSAGLRSTVASQGILAELAKQALQQQLARDELASLEGRNDETIRGNAEKAALAEYGENQRKQADIFAAQQKFAMEQAAKQREIEGGLVGEATKAFGIGDAPTIEAARARAAVQAPKLQFQMPGAPVGLDPAAGMFGEAAVFGDPSKGLSITRGDDTLYSGDTAEQRRRQQETARNALEPLLGGSEASSFAPFVASGIGMAGLGISGKDAAQAAMKYGSEAARRDAYRETGRQVTLSKDAAAARGDASLERQYWTQLQNMASAHAKGFEADVGLNAARTKAANMKAIEQMAASGTPFSQNMALLQTLKDSVKGAASDYDSRQMRSAAGALNQFELTLNSYINGGELPKNFQEQLSTTLSLLKDHTERQVKEIGIKAMDGFYASPGFIAQVNTPEEAAMFGLQVYSNITHESPTQQDIIEEANRIRPLFQQMKGMLTGPRPGALSGGGGQRGGGSVSVKGDIVDPAALGDLNLGVAPLPSKHSGNRQKAMELLRRHRAGQ